MKLERVEIKNFRSIKEATIEFNPSCRVLVGINESGKSNILKALRLLDKKAPLSKDDKREGAPNEGHIKDSYVKFIFTLEKGIPKKLFSTVRSEILYDGQPPNVGSVDGKLVTLKGLFSQPFQISYCVDTGDRKKPAFAFQFGSEFVYSPLQSDEWFKPTGNCPSDILPNHSLTRNVLVHRSKLDTIPVNDKRAKNPVTTDYGYHLYGGNGFFQKVANKDWEELLHEIVASALLELIPNVLFLDYRESELLPEKIDINRFRKDPNSLVPLKNMFLLYGIEEAKIGNFVENDLIKGSRNHCHNTLNAVALATTNYFKSVWKGKGAENIRFSLEYSNDQLITNIREENLYRLDQRSDGFKRFVYFLLTLFLQAKTDRLSNTLLLFDEPSIGLHPSSERDLRDELIKISKGNYLVYSTHSICMIDPDRIDRHYIVKKDHEITEIEEAKESNIFDEEVLLNALGYSVFEAIDKKVLIFEGWRDKRLFYVARDNANKALRDKYEKVGICHAKGAKNIKAVTSLIELANRNCLIVSDSDEPSKREQTVHKREKGYGDWKTYQEIDPTIEALTGEDFVKNDFIVKQVNAVLGDSVKVLFDATELPEKKRKLEAIKNWLKDKIPAEDIPIMITKIKTSIFDGLKYKNIDEVEYMKLLKGIADCFKASA